MAVLALLKMWLKFVLLIAFVSAKEAIERCTALGVGKKATRDGSTFVSHGNGNHIVFVVFTLLSAALCFVDCPTCDVRLAYVPAADHKEGSLCPIYIAKNDYRKCGYSVIIGYYYK